MIEQTFRLKKINNGYWFGKARQAGHLGRAGRGRRDSNGHIGKLGERRYQARGVNPQRLGVLQKSFTRRTVPEDRVSDIEASKVDGSYADHNNKITVAECARDWACDPLGTAASG